MRTKRIVSVILSMLIVCSSFAGLTAFADEANKNERTKDVASVGADVSDKYSVATGDEDVQDQSGTTGDCTWNYNASTNTLIISGNGNMPDYKMEVIWEVNSPWFNFSHDIKNVVIDKGVMNIGNFAFWNCTNLISVTIPDSVISIGENTFSDCISLTEIIIPNSVTNIGYYAFCDCTSLTSVTIPDSVTSIGDGAFRECTSLTNVTIGNSVTSIGFGTFFECESLAKVTIPNSVTSIDALAFERCKNLKDIYYSGSIEHWKQICVDDSNDGLFGANIHYANKSSQKITGVKSQYVTSAGKSFNLNAKAKSKLTYTSSNKNVAVVSSTGKVTVKAGGCAYITVKASENGNYKSATAKTKIISAPRNFTSKDVSKVKKTGKTKAKITWKSLAGATGYTVQLATNKSYKGAKTVKNSKNSATLKGLKKGKTYYVRINAYAKVSGKNYSNKWYTVKFKM